MTIRIVWPVKVNSKHIFYRVSFTGLIILTGFVLGKATNGTVVAPNFTISPNPATVGQTVTFADLSMVSFNIECDPDYIIYNWNFGAGATPPTAMQTITNPADLTTGGGASQMVVYSTPGLKTVSLMVSAEGDCENPSDVSSTATATYTFNVLVAQDPIPTVSEWGVMILVLLLLTLGVLKLRQGSREIARQVKMD